MWNLLCQFRDGYKTIMSWILYYFFLRQMNCFTIDRKKMIAVFRKEWHIILLDIFNRPSIDDVFLYEIEKFPKPVVNRICRIHSLARWILNLRFLHFMKWVFDISYSYDALILLYLVEIITKWVKRYQTNNLMYFFQQQE